MIEEGQRSLPSYGYFYIPGTFSSDYYRDQVSENPYYSSSDEHEYQYPGDPFFKICVLPKKMPGIEQETNQEDHSKNDRENGSYGIGHIINRIFNSSYLGKSRRRDQRD